MNIIFLDIDGPLINLRSRYLQGGMDQLAVRAIRDACRRGEVSIVITSQRRLTQNIPELFCANGAEILVQYFHPLDGATPDFSLDSDTETAEATRAREIDVYCQTHEINKTDCLIIDDLDLRSHIVCPQLLIDRHDGMTMSQANELEEWALRTHQTNDDVQD